MNYELKFLLLERKHQGWLSYSEEKRIEELEKAIDEDFAMQRKIDKYMPFLIVSFIFALALFFLAIGYSLKNSIEIIH